MLQYEQNFKAQSLVFNSVSHTTHKKEAQGNSV